MIIVSGLPRTGTSLMMRFLKFGGFQIYQDGIRNPDDNNPRGYFEVDSIGAKLSENPLYLNRGPYICVKVLSPFLGRIGNLEQHKVVYMERNLEEVAASMERMSGTKVSEEELQTFQRHIEATKKQLDNEGNIIYVSYNRLVKKEPRELRKIKDFLPQINLEKAVEAVDASLYRNRK